MAAPVGAHPSADTLQAFSQGKLEQFAAQTVIEHLASCSDCAKVVAAQSGDEFLARLREAKRPGTTPVPVKLAGQHAAEPTTVLPQSAPKLANTPPELAANEQYEVLRELGRGGMGVVYLARNRMMQRLEVLKVVNQDLLTRVGGKERFLREIQSAAKLNHPNVVTAYNAMQVGDLLFFAMEYVEGEDLAQVIKVRGPLPVVHACYYVQQAALGLQHAWDKQMVHRDIKPQNLILARLGRRHVVKILDFGLAKVVREKGEAPGLTGAGKMLGTPDYIAPEQAMDAARADIRADIYSLGCTFYYLLTGSPPFKGNSLFAILQAHALKEAQPVKNLRSETPPAVAAVVAKMMAKEPARRYQKPAEVAQALMPIVKGAGKALMSGPILKALPAGQKAEKKQAGRDTLVPEVSRRDTMPEQLGAIIQPSRRQFKSAFASGIGKRRWLLISGVVIAGLCLAGGLWAPGVLRVRTTDGVLVVYVNEPHSDVFVDNEVPTVKWDSDGKKGEIRLNPGTHQVVVKKDGFTPHRQTVMLEEGGHLGITARLDKNLIAARLSGEGDNKKKYLPLFNGKDKTGWKLHPNQPGDWHVENGVLIGSGPSTSHLYSTWADYRDFELRVEARIIDGGNSGVLFRAPFPGPGGRGNAPAGYETSLTTRDTGPRRTGCLLVRHRAIGDFLIHANRPPEGVLGKWVTLIVIAKGNNFTVNVNGNATAGYTDTKSLFEAGHIVLLRYGNAACEFKSVEIRELPTTPRGFTPYGGRWETRSGVVSVKADPGPLLIADGQQVGPGDEVGVEILLSGNSGGLAGLVVNLREPAPGADSFIGYEVALSSEPQSLRLGRHRHNWEPMTPDVACPVPTDRWIPLRVHLEKDGLEVFVDGRSMLRNMDREHPLGPGGIGLRTFNRPCSFRNLWVKRDGQIIKLPIEPVPD